MPKAQPGPSTRPRIRVFNETSASVRVGNLERLGEKILARMKSRGTASVALIDDARMKRLNLRHRRHAFTTDVLSFPYEPVPGETQSHRPALGRARKQAGKEWRDSASRSGYLGDIAICWPEARRNARREGVGANGEVRRLLLHGLLHLLGYDHEADDGEMAELEMKLRSAVIGAAPKVRAATGKPRVSR